MKELEMRLQQLKEQRELERKLKKNSASEPYIYIGIHMYHTPLRYVKIWHGRLGVAKNALTKLGWTQTEKIQINMLTNEIVLS